MDGWATTHRFRFFVQAFLQMELTFQMVEAPERLEGSSIAEPPPRRNQYYFKPRSELKNSRILLIEDDQSVRYTVARMLRSRGFEVIEAESGEIGINLARTANPALILSDIHMPKMDGFAVFDHLQKDPATVDIPFLFMSGGADYSRGASQLKHAVRVLEKPFGIELLMDAVSVHLGEPR